MTFSVVSSADAKEAALAFILGNHFNEIKWDECRFIWDSRGLLEPTSDGQVAIFGAKGKIATPANELLQFCLQYCLDFGPQVKYRLHAAVEERPGGPVMEQDFGDLDMASGDDETFFRDRVLELTEQAEVLGLGRAMQAFLTRPAVDGQQEKH